MKEFQKFERVGTNTGDRTQGTVLCVDELVGL